VGSFCSDILAKKSRNHYTYSANRVYKIAEKVVCRSVFLTTLF